MNLNLEFDPADAYRRLDQREAEAGNRLNLLTSWAEHVNADLAYYQQRPALEFDDAYAMNLAVWTHVNDGIEEAYADLEWIDAERALLDSLLTESGRDWRDYDQPGEWL